jgi:two-component system sensor histidine kinase KdpD
MQEPGDRPDPDALLRRIQAEEERESRARLEIWLGFAPGVGKTYAMLDDARELHDAGRDVVVGWVDTHGRYDTAALLLGLEILPRRLVPYRDRMLEEFDLDGALTRKPQVLILDELAHSNASGSRHAKRWQDVQELLDAGVEVHTTLNVQHVESLNDVVAQITGVRVRETVPDAIVDRADEITLVDLPPEELLERLREGKVYLGEHKERAARGFFRRGNLLALRELALRRAAERVDADVLAWRREHEVATTWPVGERILVCVGPAPASARLVRAARRMAAGLRAPWVAAWVERPGTTPLSKEDRERLDAHLRLAESLGATVVRLISPRPSEAILTWAREHNVTRIVIGKPTHSRWWDVLRGSLLEEIVRGSGEIDVHVISGDPTEETPARGEEVGEAGRERARWTDYVAAAALAGVGTAMGLLAWRALEPPDLAMLYLLVIMIAAVRWGQGPSTLAAALSVAAYDFFFVPPYLTFAVADLRHALTFAMMFVTGLVISRLALRIRRQERAAVDREERTATLYALARDLGAAVDEQGAARALAQHAARALGCGAAVLLPDAHGALALAARSGEVTLDSQRMGVARFCFEHEQPAGSGTDTLPGAGVRCEPLRAGTRAAGVLVLEAPAQRRFTHELRELVDAFARQGALAIERAVLAEEAKAAAVRARTEELRSSLLSAVSHDLRTPLAAITGAATALRDEAAGTPVDQRAELLDTIVEEARRLERLVVNLLDMTRFESGTVEPSRDWVPLEELVGAALVRLEGPLAGREIHTDLPADLPLVFVDPLLIEQLLINLLDNAARYTPPGSPIEIRAAVREGRLELEVADRGAGLPPGEESRVFEKFYRGPHAVRTGAGLGLAICRAIAAVHRGVLIAENREGGGALFRLALPLGAPLGTPTPPSLDEEAPA